MSNLSDFFGATVVAAPLPYQQFAIGESKTWTVGVSGKVKVILTGGGGQGAFVYNSGITNSGSFGDAPGGGAGGYSEKVLNVVAGETYTVTIGAGGRDPVVYTSMNADRNGFDGGNSSFVTATAATSVNMLANGGGGGLFLAQPQNAGQTAPGGTGGTASGGDINITGGRGGNIIRASTSYYSCMATGGGAVGLYGIGYNGGDITIRSNQTNYLLRYATGGAGIGGNGGDLDETGRSNGIGCNGTAGGSAASAGASIVGTAINTSTTTAKATEVSPGSPTGSSSILNMIDLHGSGGNGAYYNYTASAGGGQLVAEVEVLHKLILQIIIMACTAMLGHAGAFGGGGALNSPHGYGNSVNGAKNGAGGGGGGGSGGLNSRSGSSEHIRYMEWRRSRYMYYYVRIIRRIK